MVVVVVGVICVGVGGGVVCHGGVIMCGVQRVYTRNDMVGVVVVDGVAGVDIVVVVVVFIVVVYCATTIVGACLCCL